MRPAAAPYVPRALLEHLATEPERRVSDERLNARLRVGCSRWWTASAAPNAVRVTAPNTTQSPQESALLTTR